MDLPFRLKLKCYGRITELVCTRVLRVLPGKRLVCFGKWNDRQVVAKVFLAAGSAERHCAREERGVSALKDNCIETPPLLCRGVLIPCHTPVLVFQRLVHAQNFAEVWEQEKNGDRCADLLIWVVKVIADQHSSGLKQDDLHLGNFLLSGSIIYTIDGDAVDVRQIGKPLTEAVSLKNLGLFFAQLNPRFDDLIPKVFQAYVEKRRLPVEDALYARLMKEVCIHRRRRKRVYLKKIYRECSAFVCCKDWNRFMVCNRGEYDKAMDRFLSDPDTVIDSSRLLKDGNSSTVALVEIGGQRFVVKRYNIKSMQHALKRCLRSSRASISWRNAHRLDFIGISTPKPIAFLEKRWGIFRTTAYFITEYVQGVDAYHLIHAERGGEIPRQSVVKWFVELLRLFAEATISHGDFKATNFIVSGDELFVIDLDGMHKHRFRWRFRKAFKRDCERLIKNWADLPEVDKMFRDQLQKLKL
ncbi:MAG: hypothetical protein JRI32_03025 [Deltaproteobacteria bacterium]|nr:hypothetical protein [Deltaproteobacteria bacterium]